MCLLVTWTLVVFTVSVCGVNPVLADGILNMCGIDTVVSGNISGGLCDLDRVSGGGDTNVSRVDTVVSGDSVSPGVVVHVAGMSLEGEEEEEECLF